MSRSRSLSRALVAAAAAVLVAAGGCGPKAQLRNDPFANLGRGRAPRTRPPADSGGSLRDRDYSRGGGTRLEDPMFDDATDRKGSGPDAKAEPKRDDRAFDDDVPPKQSAFSDAPVAAAPDRGTKGLEQNSNAARQASTPATGAASADFASLRQRLEKAGCKNRVLETDEVTGEVFFRCQVEHPRDPTVMRVFEAKDKDELSAMQEVTVAVEKWLVDEKDPKPR